MVHRIEVRNRNNTKIDSTCSITIKDPCDFTLVDNAAYSQDSPVVTGDYLYNYSISSNATYGQYVIETSTTTSSLTNVDKDRFYIMPWKLDLDVRYITGANETKDIDDDALSDLCWKAYQEALRDVYKHVYKERPLCNPDTGNYVNGSNTVFQTRQHPLADINGDGHVTGNGTSCATDVTGYWINSAGSRQNVTITITNPLSGEISIYQEDGSTAIPSTYEGLYLDYWVEHESYDEEIFRNAVAHLAADMVIRRLKENYVHGIHYKP